MSTSDRPPRHDHSPDIFVSYRRTDKEFVAKLVPVLESLGPSVWWDADIEGGEDWRDSIVEHLAASRCLVIVFSEACNTSKQLKKELAVADHLDKAVIPVLIEETEPRGFFLYELAPLNWISIYPAPLGKVDSVAQLLVERLEKAGWTALPVVAPTVPVETPVVPFAPPAPPVGATFAPPATALPPPAPPRPVTPSSVASAAPLPTVTDRKRLGLRDVFPFRRVDFILPTVVGVMTLFGSADGVGVRVGTALFMFVLVLALTGLIAFPIRYYRRRSNPHRVARNLIISNVVLALAALVGGAMIAPSIAEEGDTANATHAYLAIGLFMFGLLCAAISFVLFVLLSRHRAKEAYKDGIKRL